MNDFWIMMFRTLILYFFIMFSMRIMGKREIGKLSVFDLVVSIIIAEIAAFTIDDPKLEFYKGIFPILLLVTIQILISYLSLKSKSFREIVEGKSTILIEKGKINDREMARHRYNMDDLLIQLREKNISNLSDVEFAFLEPSGKLSVIKKPEKMPVTLSDLGLPPKEEGMPLPVIVDGEVLDENLEKLGKTRLWLKQQLKPFGSTDFQKVMFASADPYGRLYVDYKDPPQT
ncbi:conserved membrane hypothetical protein [[Clostridium] ultunense Esp]|uniref:DUF421 domain-containing protein n=1 Tax=Thermicanus aegyptius TaxID=94009 RepID=UPI0002B70F36|nr:DUF421 domain-containing protein [Thermicanus aegyptius]CCQ93284.1 conserved membrane hypothetical protein [[Clostridium] ultunense Esp]